MIGYVTIGTNNFEKAKAFYDGSLGISAPSAATPKIACRAIARSGGPR